MRQRMVYERASWTDLQGSSQPFRFIVADLKSILYGLLYASSLLVFWGMASLHYWRRPRAINQRYSTKL